MFSRFRKKKHGLTKRSQKEQFTDLKEYLMRLLCDRQYAFSNGLQLPERIPMIVPLETSNSQGSTRENSVTSTSAIPVTPGYVQSVCKAGKGQGVKRKRDGIDKPSCQSKLRSTETRDTSNVVTFVPVDSKRYDIFLPNVKS